MNWHWAQHWADERYHLLKLIGMTALILLAIVGAGFGIGIFQQSEAVRTFASWPPKLLTELGLYGLIAAAFGAALIGFFIGLAVLHGKGPSAAFTDGRRFDWDLMFSGAVLWIVLLVGLAVIDPTTGQSLLKRFGDHDAAAWALLASAGLAVFFIQSGAEEVVFRGYLQPFLAAWFKSTWLGVLVATILFTAAHLGEISVWGIGSVALLGLTLGIAAVRAGTIAPAVGLHVSNNWVQVLASPDVTNASVSQQDFVHVAILCGIWTVWLLYETSGDARAD
jgi:uncharacterized protein